MITGFGNNVVSALAENVTSIQTTLTVMPEQGAMFAKLLTTDMENDSNPQSVYAILTLTNTSQTVNEICHLTAVRGDVLTVVRGQEGTTARGWSLNDVVANFATRGSENGFVQAEQLQTGQYTAAVAGGSEDALTIQLPGTFFLNGSTDWDFRTPLIITPTLTNTGAATLQVTVAGRVLGTFPLYKGKRVELEAGDILADVPIACLLDKTKTFFSVMNPVNVYSLGDGLVRSVNKEWPDDKGAVTLTPRSIGAVQANGGLHSSGNHAYYLDWGADGKLHITVDATDVGELFTTQNPPSVSQIDGAYPKTGGYLYEEASISLISNTKNPANGDYVYSPMYRAVIKGRGGDQDFADGASGVMRIVEHVGYEAYLQLQWDGFGSVHEFIFDQNGCTRIHGKAFTGGGQSYLNEDGNVYGPVWGGWLSSWVLQQVNALNVALNNQITTAINNSNQWASQSFVTGHRQASAQWSGPLGGAGLQVPAGCVVIGARNNGSSDVSHMGILYAAEQICINGNWMTVGLV